MYLILGTHLKGVHMKYSYDQQNKIARAMAFGAFGSFANHIGDAFLVASYADREILFKAFEGLFNEVAQIGNIKPTEEA